MSHWHKLETIGKRIEAEKPDVVATTAFTAGIVDALKVLKLAKEINPRIVTVIGNVHPTFCYEEILRDHHSYVDYIVRGEGEVTLVDVLHTPPVGSGYDVLAADDVQDSVWAETPDKLEKLDAAYSETLTLLTPVVMPQTIVLMSNTMFAPGDLVNRTRDRLAAQNPDLVREGPAEIVDEGQCDKYVYNEDRGPLGGRIHYPYFKEDLFSRYIKYPKKTEYVRQFALSMRSAKETALDVGKVNWYDEVPKDIAQRCRVYIDVDPSLGSKDPSSFWVWGLTHDKRKFWLDGVTRKLDPSRPEFWDILFRLAMKWNALSQGVVEIRIEDAGQSTWSSLAESKLSTRRTSAKGPRARPWA